MVERVWIALEYTYIGKWTCDCVCKLDVVDRQKETKLHTTKRGPYRVLSHIGTVYTVERLVTGEIEDFHVTKLSEYNVDEDNEDIVRAAKIDDEYADITSVIDHKFVPPSSKRRTSIQFLLTWEDDAEPKWYPWNATLGGNELIHECLNNKRMRQYIPQKFTHPKDHPDEIARREEMKNKRINENNTRKNKRNWVFFFNTFARLGAKIATNPRATRWAFFYSTK